MGPIRIDSLDDARLDDYRALRAAHANPDRFSRRDGLFVSEGEVVFRMHVRSGFAVKSVVLTPTRLESVRDALSTLDPAVPIYLIEQSAMNTLAGFPIHRGLLAIGLRKPDQPGEQLIASARLLLVLENLANHDNIGGVFRNAAALSPAPGATAVLLSPGCADPLYRKALRVSVGCALHVPFARLPDWPAALGAIRRAGFRILGLSPRADLRDIADVAQGAVPERRLALLLGAEGPGLSPGAMNQSDELVRIPLGDGIDSLNVATAAAVALYALRGRT